MHQMQTVVTLKMRLKWSEFERGKIKEGLELTVEKQKVDNILKLLFQIIFQIKIILE